jgi:alkylation response protein AidB-like acyl-CoA dehydrogenase
MAMDVDAARLAVYDAAARIDAGEEASGHASRAKIVCTEAARRVTATAHQVMGGAGFLEDCDLQLFTRRAKALESRLGTPDEHRERLADAMGVS